MAAAPNNTASCQLSVLNGGICPEDPDEANRLLALVMVAPRVNCKCSGSRTMASDGFQSVKHPLFVNDRNSGTNGFCLYKRLGCDSSFDLNVCMASGNGLTMTKKDCSPTSASMVKTVICPACCELMSGFVSLTEVDLNKITREMDEMGLGPEPRLESSHTDLETLLEMSFSDTLDNEKGASGS